MHNERMAWLITRIFELNREYYHLAGLRDYQQLGPSATEKEIQDIEQRFSLSLPEDYREFLRAYNGWCQFEGQMDLLSTKQMCDARMLENFAYVKGLAKEQGEFAVAAGFVIQGCATSADIVFLDFAGKELGCAPDVVRWEFEEINRCSSFTAYLEHSLQVAEELVIGERERLR